MVEQSILKKYDISGMYKIYEQWPEISEEAYSSNLKQVEFDTIDHIIFVGMGGSGAIGDVFGSILSKAKIHVSVVKGYVLPSTVDSKSLVIVISISGNTIETLSVLESAKIIGCKIIAISSGGKMEKFCKNIKLNLQNYPNPFTTCFFCKILLFIIEDSRTYNTNNY